MEVLAAVDATALLEFRGSKRRTERKIDDLLLLALWISKFYHGTYSIVKDNSADLGD